MTNRRHMLRQVREFSLERTPMLPYHNFGHEMDVAQTSLRLGVLEGLSPEGLFLIETAAYLHDCVYAVGAPDNEERTAALAEEALAGIGYSPLQTGAVASAILATKWPQHPHNRLEQVLCDADVDSFGRPDFLHLCDAILAENLPGLPNGQDRLHWYRHTMEFVAPHRYHTEAQRALRDQGKQHNLELLRCLTGTEYRGTGGNT